ncbi:MAG: flagellar hook-basal body protein [Lachnospiraceae bacterium]|nr:flagellar hook-basal body protein [Lachnospiraceae bacterium]
MVRSLWSAATGMHAQQTNLDVIANNLANVNTTGYKTDVVEFKSLLYQNLQTKTTTANGEHKPIGSQVGLGVRQAAITSIFRQGSLLESSSSSSFAIEGSGFFQIQAANGEKMYTRNGNFNWAMDKLNGENAITLTDSDGRPVLSSEGQKITLPTTRANGSKLAASEIQITSDGEITYPDALGNMQKLGVTIGVFQFQNPAGLYNHSNSLYSVTDASGPAMNEATTRGLQRSRVVQGYLEGSNVQVADEMVNMIVAQRAYEMNSKVIQTSDSMMDTANNLRR